MTIISGVRIHPGFFNKRQAFKESRIGAAPFKIKKTVIHKPVNPKAKYAMPLVAVVGAFMAVGAAVAATTVWSVITAIGAVTAAVGAVTGNKNLIKIGSVIGIAGFVGGMASSAGLFGEGGTFGSAAPTSPSTSGNPSGNPSGYEGDAGDLAGAGQSSPSMINNPATPPAVADAGQAASASMAPPEPPPNAAQAADNSMAAYTPPDPATPVATTSGVPDVAPVAPTGTPPPTPNAAEQITASAQAPTPAPTQPQSFASSYQQDAGGAVGPGQAGMGLPSTPIPGAPPSATPFDDLMGKFGKLGSGVADFAKNNSLLATSIFSGISSAADPSQRNLRDAQANNLNSNSAYTEQLRKNQSSVGGPIDWNKVFGPTTVKKGG